MKRRVRQIVAAAMTVTTLCMAAVAPAYANEEEQYPLKGTFPYTLMTKEIVDKRLAEGWVFTGDPYADVGTATPFTNNLEWSQVNQFKNSATTGANSGRILLTLAGLKPSPDGGTYSSELTAEEEAVKNEVIKYLNSYDWKNASDYEKAYYTAEYIASRCTYDYEFGNDNNTSYSCLVKGKSACDGFAQTYHLLTRAAGLKSIETGDGRLNHAWNYVMIDGQWYKIDLTGISQSNEAYEATGNQFDYLTIDYNVKEALATPATDIDQYIWTEMGIELSEGDSTLPDQPMY